LTKHYRKRHPDYREVETDFPEEGEAVDLGEEFITKLKEEVVDTFQCKFQ